MNTYIDTRLALLEQIDHCVCLLIKCVAGLGRELEIGLIENLLKHVALAWDVMLLTFTVDCLRLDVTTIAVPTSCNPSVCRV